MLATCRESEQTRQNLQKTSFANVRCIALNLRVAEPDNKLKVYSAKQQELQRPPSAAVWINLLIQCKCMSVK